MIMQHIQCAAQKQNEGTCMLCLRYAFELIFGKLTNLVCVLVQQLLIYVAVCKIKRLSKQTSVRINSLF